ncbi:hypothetical protein [Streptomyces flavidovirens]|uniref:hypothetical protein n=1 Tax=Streptomyces flavidovirens TaxID=67298 RepID=UPI00040BC70F|nr:hypothetical protein [Streptomyces flavidovirens]
MTGLAAVVVFTALLPLAGASAEPEPVPAPDDAKAAPATAAGNAPASAPVPAPAPAPVPVPAPAPASVPSPGSLGDASAQCGPELSSPEGVEGQTCVLTERGSTWARTYYRNATGAELRAVLALMGPAGRTVQMHCAVSAEDEPGVCETPREPSRGKAAEYSAVSEFAAAGDGPLLLRSGSNSPAPAPR